MARSQAAKPRRRQRLKEYDPFRYWGRMRMGILMGGCLGLFGLLVAPAVSVRNETLGTIFRYLPIIAPLLGIVFHDVIDRLVGRAFAPLFWPEGGATPPAHSKGEALVQRARFEDALDWFAAAVMSDPGDWRAQLRIVEILEKYLDDPERLAEERNRLLKHGGVPQAVWVQTAFSLGRYWEEVGRGDLAAYTYQGILWKFPGDDGAADALRRIEELRAKGQA